MTMHERVKLQHIPLKVYRSSDRLMVATPMPGLQPEDIAIQVSEKGHVVINGELRGMLKDIKELLIDEWSVGGYQREFDLSLPVDAVHANVNYGNGVLVIAFPLTADKTTPATLTLMHSGVDRGERSGNAGHTI